MMERKCLGLWLRYSLLIAALTCVMTYGRARAAQCRTGINDVASKAFLAPLVFEATVTGVITHPVSISQSARDTDAMHSPSSHHQVRLQVGKVYKGDIRNRMRSTSKDNGYERNGASSNNYNNRNSRTAGLGQMAVDFWSKPNSAISPECTFNASLFEVGVKYIVFASEMSKDIYKMFDPAPRYTLFSEPVRQNKTSSRHVRKVLCAACASPPNVTSITDLTAKSFKEKSQIKITCKTSGNPTPNITWFKDGEPLKLGGRVQFRQRKYQSKVVLTNAKVMDSGEYECRAISEFSPAASKKTKVIVVRGRKPPVNPSTTTPVITTWSYEGTECPYPNICLNGGKCRFFSNIAEQVCECAEGYNGQRCETKGVQNLAKPETMYLKSILIVVVILGVLFSVFATYIICRKERCTKRKTKDKSRRSSFDEKETVSAGDTITMLPQDGPTTNITEIIPNSMLQRAKDNNEHESKTNEDHSGLPISCNLNKPPKILEKAGAHRTQRLYGVSTDCSTDTLRMTTLHTSTTRH